MTSQERVKCVLRHEEPDRVPIYDSVPGSNRKQMEKGGTDILRAFHRL